MALTLYYMSGSPYAWRVWLALEHKGMAYDLKVLSYDAGDFEKPDFARLTPRRKVPVLVDDGFVLWESAAILDYLEDKQPQPPLFSADIRRRAVERRMVREADEYVATAMEELADAVMFTPPERRVPERIASAVAALRQELALWERAIEGDYLAGALSAADLALFPQLALVRRLGGRNPGLLPPDLLGPRLAAWLGRMEALPIARKTWPPHWKG
ncbi:MAG TPA: glutathione S-transferase family protein [Stellaceae bacterium]|nr:glutathione S-transferase family protein [Stellaceae bacterium]